METTLIHRLKKQSGPRKGQIWATLRADKIPGGDVYIAAAIVNKKDKYDKKIGDEIVIGRINCAAASDESRCVFLDKPIIILDATSYLYPAVKIPLRRFINRCQRFFKNDPVYLASPFKITPEVNDAMISHQNYYKPAEPIVFSK